MLKKPIHYTIVTGNPITGFHLYEDFKSMDEATHASLQNADQLQPGWWIMPVYRLNYTRIIHPDNKHDDWLTLGLVLFWVLLFVGLYLWF